MSLLYDGPGLVQLLHILAPQLSYDRPASREDGFASRVERAIAIYERGGLVRGREHTSGVMWRIPSWRHPHTTYTVWLDREDGEHQCDCYDRSCCCHRLAAGIAEYEYQQGHPTATRRRMSIPTEAELWA